jgi:hypothetical protein
MIGWVAFAVILGMLLGSVATHLRSSQAWFTIFRWSAGRGLGEGQAPSLAAAREDSVKTLLDAAASPSRVPAKSFAA